MDMPVGNLVQFLFLANIFFQPVQVLGEQYNQALAAMAGAERIRHLLSTEPQWNDPPDALRPRWLRGEVSFDGVTFGYQPDRPVLDEISFTAEPGQVVALVGHTGSGKTSIINLIAKYYLPSGGRLLIDGYDIRQLQTDWLRRQMGIVLQQNFLMTGSVLENVRLGRPEASDEEVAQAIDALGCLDLFVSLPHGLHTEVGESGMNLSLGQRQLVCFARAMLADPRLLILDEATSSVDAATEHRIQEALSRLLRGRTSFIVAHRLSTIREADLVLVLDNGRIVERGTHEELLAYDGVYAGLCQSSLRASAA
jgi:ATP-binding cassette subfamily B protein